MMGEKTKERIFIDKSIEILNGRKSRYDKIKDEGIAFLKRTLEGTFPGITISGRLKDASKLPEKIYRKNYINKYESPDLFIDDLPDGIGIRVICLMKNEEDRIYSILKERLTRSVVIFSKEFCGIDEENIFIDLSNQPERQKNNLEIYRMDAVYMNGVELVRIEIQIKCLTHYFWGELEHSLFYKNYDYTMSNNFYADLMKNINSSLENLDYEIELLQKHMVKTPDKQVIEVREIAALMLSKKYENQVEGILGCKIDLREAYAVIVDMHFGIMSNTVEALKILDNLNARLNNGHRLEEKYAEVTNQRINEHKIGPAYLELAKILDKNIHSGDVFWKFLFLFYQDLYSEPSHCYSDILQGMAQKIRMLYFDVLDAADALQYSELNLQELVDRAFDLFMLKNNKLGYYSLSFGLCKIKDAMRKCICNIQNQIVLTDPDMNCY